uniref:Monodehydroascorbate reductase n=1 Tax=Tanacetum cinerariifolium TaxID=118510 RepID=A0A6L2PA11_TANCI|nr:monodehydroascorbate reductase [Tanacetum cinerariifolium]
MDNKKHIVNLEYFKEMLHICPRLSGQTFDELPFKDEILAFLRFSRHSGEIWMLTDVNINKLHQPWRSFAAIINKCLSGKSIGYDSLRLSQAQILWGLYHKKNVDFAYLLWEDFIYQVEHKDAKKSNEMYYPRFTKVIIHYFMNKDPSIPKRNKEYYAVASETVLPKTKASVRKTKSSSDTSITPPTTAGTRLSTFAKGKQPTKASKPNNEGTGIIPGVLDVPTKESDEEIYWISSDEDDDVDEGSDDQDDDDDNQDEGHGDDQDTDEEGEEFIHPKLSIHDEEETKEEESFDPIPRTPENSNDEEGRVVQMKDVHITQEFEDSHVTLTLVNPDGQQQSSSVSSQFVTSMLNPTPDARIDSFFETNSQMDVQAPTIVASFTLSAPTLTPSTIPTISTSDRLRDEAQAENEKFLKNLDENIQKIIKEQVKEQVKVQVSKILLKIEKTVNEQLEAEVLTRLSNSSKTSYAVAADLSEMELKKILIGKMEGNKSIHRSNKQRNLYKALVEVYESVKIILDIYGDVVTLKRRHDDDADKDEEPSAGSDRGSKRRREGKEPESTSAPKENATRTTGKSTQGSKSQQRTASESAPAEEPLQNTHDLEEPSHQEFVIGAADDQPLAEASDHPEWFQQPKKPPTPDRDWNKTLPATHESIQLWISELAKQADSRSSFNELMDTPVDFSAFLMNRLKVDTLTPELLAGPTYKLVKGSCKSLVELEFFLEEVYKANTVQLDWNNPEGQQYPHNLLKPLPLIPKSQVQRRRLQEAPHLRHRRYVTASGSRKANKSDGQRMLCFQRLSKNVHKKHRNPKACGRPSIRNGTARITQKESSNNGHKNGKRAHLTKEYPYKNEDKVVEQRKYIGSLEETIIKYCDESIKKQDANDEWIRKFIKNTNLNLRALDITTKNLQVKADQLAQMVLTNVEERVEAEIKIGKKDMKEPVPRNLHVVQPHVLPTLFPGHLKKQKDNPYKTLKTVCMIVILEKIHKMKSQEDERDIDDGWDITIKDVKRLRKILTPTIHTLPNLEIVVQPYMPRGPVCDEVKFVREEELEYDIPIQNGVMQPLTSQTVHMTSCVDDYVARATILFWTSN